MKYFEKSIILFILFLFLMIFIRTAWVGDDVFITLRTVDNFLNGYGLRWNVVERVQSYTHPLWMLIMVPVYALIRDGYATALFISFLMSLVTLVVFGFLYDKSFSSVLLGYSVFMFSKAFIDYSVSGLENPLTHLLAILFIFFLFNKFDSDEKENWKKFFWLVVFASISSLNRIDSLLFYSPVLLYYFNKYKSWKTFLSGLLGFMLFFLWEAFSFFYYGFPFPNTAYAKLNTGISRQALIRQGFVYFYDSFSRDPLTLTVIVFSLGLAFWRGNAKERLIAFGVFFYLIYVVNIGGDFMSGRFFSTALLVSVLLLVKRVDAVSSKMKYLMTAGVVFIGLLAPYPTISVEMNQPMFTDHDLDTGINDERAFYYPISGLMIQGMPGTINSGDSGWVERGLKLKQKGKHLVVAKNVGYMGYYAGPNVYILDTYALNDPLLARLHIPAAMKWRIGHFDRPIPNGYLATLQSGTNRIKDPDVAAYYDKLSLVVRGPLKSLERLRVIWEINIGYYDSLVTN